MVKSQVCQVLSGEIRLSELEFEQAIDAKMLGIGEGHDADRIAEELGLCTFDKTSRMSI